MNELEIVKKQSIESFNAMQNLAKQLSEQCLTIKVVDDTTEQTALRIVSQVKEFENAIEKKRKELKEPYLQTGRDIDTAAKMVVGVLEEPLKVAKKNIMDYKDIKEKARKKEEQRIQTIKDNIEAFRKTVISAIDACTSTTQLPEIFVKYIKHFPNGEDYQEFLPDAQKVLDSLKQYGSAKKALLLNPQNEAIQETAVAIKEELVVTSVNIAEEQLMINQSEKISDTRTNWKFELVDITKVPKFLLTIDEKKVKEFLKEHREAGSIVEDCIVHGIRFYPEKTLVVR